MAHLKVQIHGTCGTLQLDRPEQRNALSRSMIAELTEALGDLHLEKRVRGVILTGAGNAFCAGNDLHEMGETLDSESPLPQWHQDAQAYRELLETMLRFPKPLIAAVNGSALGAGAGLLLACDLVLAGRHATIGFPEPRRGLVAGTAVPLLCFRLGASSAVKLLLTGETIRAERAHQLGLVHEVVDDHLAWARAAEWVTQLSECAPTAVQLTKRMVYEIVGENLLQQLAAGAAMSAAARTTESAAEGIRAFREKRAPNWP